jgi:hypothetical protein
MMMLMAILRARDSKETLLLAIFMRSVFCSRSNCMDYCAPVLLSSSPPKQGSKGDASFLIHCQPAGLQSTFSIILARPRRS